MRVSAIPATFSNKTQAPKPFSKEQTPQLDAKNHERSISAVYPKSYYFSFKGEQKCDEIREFEKFADEFYEENKGKRTKSVNTDHLAFEIPKTDSRFVNDEFTNNIRLYVKHNKQPLIGEEMLTKTLQSAINSIESNDNAVDVIKKLKEQGKLPEKIELDQNKSELRILILILREMLINSREDWSPSKKKFNSMIFIEKIHEYLKKNNEPVFDKDLLNRIKSCLNEEPFAAFNEKILKIRAQKKVNNFPSAEKCAKEIYEDSVEKKIHPFENPKMYEFVAQNDEKLDFLLEKIYGYGLPAYEEMFNDSGFDKKQKVLLVDPCVGAHFEELVDYVKEKNIDTKNIAPFDLRKGFSDHLGTETIYRGLFAENPEELIEKLKKDGNFSKIYKNPEDALNAIKYYLTTDPNENNTVNSKIIRKIEFSKKPSEFLSASSVYDIAASVPKQDSDSETPVVVIEAEVPKLSLIKQEKRFHSMQMHSLHKVLKIGKNKYPYDRDMSKIEMFIPFYLPTDKARFSIDTTTPLMRWVDY